MQAENQEIIEIVVDRMLELCREEAGIQSSQREREQLSSTFCSENSYELMHWVKNASRKSPRARDQLMAILEDLVDGETCFFRDAAVMDWLAESVLPEIMARKLEKGDRSISVWSAGCSTGEESWSLAMLVIESLVRFSQVSLAGNGRLVNLAGWEIDITGTDISRCAIRASREAVYPRTDKDDPLERLPKRLEYMLDGCSFGQQCSCARPIEAVRQVTRFEAANLKSETKPGNKADIVYCMHVITAMDVKSRDTVLCRLVDSLAPGGWLVIDAGIVDSFPGLEQVTGKAGISVFRKAA